MTQNAVLSKLTGKLLSPLISGATGKAGRYGFRGELGLVFPDSVAGEARPPIEKADQVILAAEGEQLVFFAAHVDSLAHLDHIVALLGDALVPAGKYFLFAGNVDFSKKYCVEAGGATWHVLPLDEATVWNELLDLFYLERGDLKKASPEAKVDAVVDAAAGYNGKLPLIPYAQALAEMGPVKVAENRPV